MTFRLLIIAGIAMTVSAAVSVLIVLSQRWHGKLSLDHDLAGVQKFHETAVPRIGGIAVFAAVLATLLYCGLTAAGARLQGAGLVALMATAGLPAFVAGIAEDLTKKISVRARLLASIASAFVASFLLGATLDQLDIWGLDNLLAWTPFALVITALVVSGGVNAINIIDGFNGLAGGTVMVMLIAFSVLALHVGDVAVAEVAVLGVGAVAGFLFVNYPTGKLFLGDGGAYFLGFWVAEVAVLLLVRNQSVNAWQVLSICAYPVIEVGYSIYRRKILRQASPGSPDGLHLHTLVYRRVVSKFFPRHAHQAWKRNAAVACIILPVVALAAVLSIVGGNSIVGGIVLVVGQALTYVAIYARLVRGRWLRNTVLVSQDDVEVNVL
jgi:UDP-N-acetylmuramyl pentapeptide phosphotransferase/UDP-N-acetylglucosamine-1-phosphate transferase